MFQEPLPVDEHQKLYGYNFEKIHYPIKEDKEFQKKWIDRIMGKFDFPSVMIPEYKDDLLCKHGLRFSSSDENLLKESPTLVLYSELKETVYDIAVYARRSDGPCRCLLRVDGTKYLVWNIGQGRCVDFTLLFSYLHKWVHSGIKIYAMWKSIVYSASSSGISCTLEYNDLHRSVTGFVNNLNIDFERAYSCPNHGTSPKWLVSDGKNVGPLKIRVNHLKELDVEPTDEKILMQSTLFKDRVFLNTKKERVILCRLLTGELPMNEFVEISEITSPNGLLLVNLVRHILEKYPEEMPSC